MTVLEVTALEVTAPKADKADKVRTLQQQQPPPPPLDQQRRRKVRVCSKPFSFRAKRSSCVQSCFGDELVCRVDAGGGRDHSQRALMFGFFALVPPFFVVRG